MESANPVVLHPIVLEKFVEVYAFQYMFDQEQETSPREATNISSEVGINPSSQLLD